MKAIARISAITATLSVAGLQSGGAWAWVALAVGLVSVAALVGACRRLGYFEMPGAGARGGQVVYLEEYRRAVPREIAPEAQPYRGSAGVRGR
jgi:amino acid transporter